MPGAEDSRLFDYFWDQVVDNPESLIILTINEKGESTENLPSRLKALATSFKWLVVRAGSQIYPPAAGPEFPHSYCRGFRKWDNLFNFTASSTILALGILIPSFLSNSSLFVLRETQGGRHASRPSKIASRVLPRLPKLQRSQNQV
jgi:hypothetical protein